MRTQRRWCQTVGRVARVDPQRRRGRIVAGLERRCRRHGAMRSHVSQRIRVTSSLEQVSRKHGISHRPGQGQSLTFILHATVLEPNLSQSNQINMNHGHSVTVPIHGHLPSREFGTWLVRLDDWGDFNWPWLWILEGPAERPARSVSAATRNSPGGTLSPDAPTAPAWTPCGSVSPALDRQCQPSLILPIQPIQPIPSHCPNDLLNPPKKDKSVNKSQSITPFPSRIDLNLKLPFIWLSANGLAGEVHDPSALLDNETESSISSSSSSLMGVEFIRWAAMSWWWKLAPKCWCWWCPSMGLKSGCILDWISEPIWWHNTGKRGGAKGASWKGLFCGDHNWGCRLTELHSPFRPYLYSYAPPPASRRPTRCPPTPAADWVAAGDQSTRL